MKNLSLMPDMAVAWKAGRKTMTRRLMKPQPKELHFSPQACKADDYIDENGNLSQSRFQVGDRVRLLTTWAVHRCYDHLKPTELPGDVSLFWSYFDTPYKPDAWAGRLRPGRFLPRFLRHLMPTTTVLDVRAERVQDISEEDARAEGISEPKPDSDYWRDRDDFARCEFRGLWESIHGPGAWERNDWVWAYKLEGPKGD